MLALAEIGEVAQSMYYFDMQASPTKRQKLDNHGRARKGALKQDDDFKVLLDEEEAGSPPAESETESDGEQYGTTFFASNTSIRKLVSFVH